MHDVSLVSPFLTCRYKAVFFLRLCRLFTPETHLNTFIHTVYYYYNLLLQASKAQHTLYRRHFLRETLFLSKIMTENIKAHNDNEHDQAPNTTPTETLPDKINNVELGSEDQKGICPSFFNTYTPLFPVLFY